MRVLIADDHGLFRAGLRSLVSRLCGTDVQVREVGSMRQAMAILPEGFTLALFDLSMPGEETLWQVPAIRQTYPDLKIAIISGSDEREDVVKALAVGVHGFIHKSQTDAEVEAALRDVLDGRIYVPPSLSNLAPHHGDGHEANIRRTADLQHLTERQRDVLRCLARGLTNKEVARSLSIAEPTVKIHVSALMRTLGVRNRTEAAVVARRFFD